MIHPKACVGGADIVIGPRTRVWQFASVIRGALIGADCSIGSSAVVDGATIGDRSTVGHGAAVNPGVVIGCDVFVGPRVVFCNDAWPRTTKEGFDAAIFAGGFVTVRVHDRASIGAGAIILPGIVIGADAMIAAGAVVDRNVAPWSLFRRDGQIDLIEPARPRHRMREAL